MHIEIYILIGFFLLLSGMVLLYRKSTLARLDDLPGETIISEESPVDVIQAGAPRTVYFHSCVIRLTDRRIIIAQKIPLTKNSHFLRAVIDHSSPEPGMDLKSTLRRGYLNFHAGKDEISVTPGARGLTVSIVIPRSPLNRRQYLEFTARRGDAFMSMFGQVG